MEDNLASSEFLSLVFKYILFKITQPNNKPNIKVNDKIDMQC